MSLIRLLRFSFHLLYHQFAWTYDWIAAGVSAGYWKDWVLSVIEHLDGCERILEIGHGPGHLMQTLLERKKCSVVGVDLSPQMGRLAREKLVKVTGRPSLVRADARALPFAGRAFDAVVATFPSEYIAEPETWSSFSRMVHPEGKIVVLLGARPVGYHPLNLLSRLLFRLTGQIGSEEIDAARELLEAHLAELELEIRNHTGLVRSSETFYVIARPAPTPAV